MEIGQWRTKTPQNQKLTIFKLLKIWPILGNSTNSDQFPPNSSHPNWTIKKPRHPKTKNWPFLKLHNIKPLGQFWVTQPTRTNSRQFQATQIGQSKNQDTQKPKIEQFWITQPTRTNSRQFQARQMGQWKTKATNKPKRKTTQIRKRRIGRKRKTWADSQQSDDLWTHTKSTMINHMIISRIIDKAIM